MALNTLSITPAEDNANIALHGDMSVLFEVAVGGSFKVNLFTITSELFIFTSSLFKFKDLTGALTNSFSFGGKPGLFVEFMFDVVARVWYVVANNLQSIDTNDLALKVQTLTDALAKIQNTLPPSRTVEAQIVQDYDGFPLYDVGDHFTYKGVSLRKIDNGFSTRYAVNACRINAEMPAPNLTDPALVANQTLGYLTIPGGTLVGKTSAVLNATFDCPAQWGSAASSFWANIYSDGDGLVGSFYVGTGGTTGTSLSISNVNVKGTDSSTLTVSGGNLFVSSGSTSKRCNLLKDIVIRLSFTPAAGFGRAVSLRSATLDFLDSITVAQSGSKYRNATQQPFRSSSFWNTPLGNGATFQAATDPETASIITTNPGGVPAGAWPWISGAAGGANNFVELSATDPISNFTYAARCPRSPWPFSASANGNGAFRMHAPASEFITGQSSDRVITLITPDKRYVLESGTYSYNAVTNTHNLGYCTVWDLYGGGLSNNIDSTIVALSEGYRASGHPLTGGIIRNSDLNALQINHVVAMQLSNYQQKCAAFSVVGTPADGTSFSVKPTDPLQTAQSFASLFKAGSSVYFAGAAYVLIADATYNASTNITSFDVKTTITGTSTVLYLGGTVKIAQQLTQFVWPASCMDNGSVSIGAVSFYRGLVPMGAMFGIPPDVDLTMLNIKSAEGMALARAFQQFGGVNNDTTSKTFSLCFMETGATDAQKSNLRTDCVAIRNALRMITNITAANPGGPGARVTTYPSELQPLY